MEITQELASKVLSVVDSGLCAGIGKPIPGQMCVEAAVCYAMGLPHSDEPACVSPVLRALKIKLNDKNWSSNESRAKGLRRLALAQLGSAGNLHDAEFARRLARLAVTSCSARALRAAASRQKSQEHKDNLIAAALRCEKEGTREAALAGKDAAADAYDYADADADAAAYAAYAYAAADAAAYAYDADAYADAYDYDADAYDKALSDFAEEVVQILVDMKAPGCQWLPLTEE